MIDVRRQTEGIKSMLIPSAQALSSSSTAMPTIDINI